MAVTLDKVLGTDIEAGKKDPDALLVERNAALDDSPQAGDRGEKRAVPWIGLRASARVIEAVSPASRGAEYAQG